MKIISVKDSNEAGVVASKIIADKINAKHNTILGLATGSTPITTYQNLVELYNNKKVSFKDVTAFNLDEYKGIAPNHEQSYKHFMNVNLFNLIDINKDNTFIPDGIDTSNPTKYDIAIDNMGGVDLQLLGIGVNGHIGFNEPGTSFDSVTSVVDLAKSTIEVNARFFDNLSDVPTQAVSMGLKTIMGAKEILLIATGENKSEAVAQLVEGEVSNNWPCTILQKHNNVIVIVDEAAKSKLKNKL